MRFAHIAAALALVSCGGQVTGQPGAGSGSGSGEHSGTPDASASGSGTGLAGSYGSGSSQGSITAAECPSICTYGCPNGTCVVDCPQDSCTDEIITCPEGVPCDVECTTGESCSGANIQCPSTGSCIVNCSNSTACDGATVACGSGPCILTCNGMGFYRQIASVTGCGANCMNNCPPM
jgi:hypothetical protein